MFQADDVALEVSCAGPGLGLDDPDVSLPTQWVYDSTFLWFYEWDYSKPDITLEGVLRNRKDK